MKSKVVITVMVLMVLAAAYGACALPSGSVSAPGKTPAATAPAPSLPDWESKWQRTVAAAKQEGTVLVYTSQGQGMRQEIGEAFGRKFGIKVEFVTLGTSQLLNKTLMERRAGLYLADVLLIGTSTLVAEFKPKGLLEPIRPAVILPEAKNLDVWIGGSPFVDADGTTVGLLSIFTRSYLARNTDLVKANEIASYQDLTDPRWKGKMVMYDPTISGAGASWITSLEQVWGRDENMSYLRALAAQDLTLTRERRNHVEWVARGKFPLGLGVSQSDMAVIGFQMGAPIAYVDAKEGGVITAAGGGMGLLTMAAHPNAALTFVNWMMTQEGGVAMVKGHGNPSRRKDVPTTGLDPGLIPPPGVRTVNGDSEQSIAARTFWQDISKNIFAQYFK